MDRPLDGIEQNLLRLSRDCGGAMKVAVRLQLDQPVDIPALRLALNKLEARHPLARAIVKDSVTLEILSVPGNIVSIVERVKTNTKSWLSVWDELQNVPARVGASGMTIGVVNGSTDSDLIVVADHFMCDGVSLMEFAHELLQTLVDPNKQWPALQPSATMLECIRESIPSQWQRFKAITSHITFLVIDAFIIRTAMVPKAPITDRTSFAKPSYLASATLSADTSAQLATFAKTFANARMNAVLTRAAIQALSEMVDIEGKSRIIVGCSVNARPRYTTDKTVTASDLGLHSTGLSLREVTGGPTSAHALWLGVRKVHEETQRLAQSKTHIFESMLAAPIVWPAQPQDDKGPTGIISNWGKSPFEKVYGAGGAGIELLHAQPLMNFNICSCPFITFSATHGKVQFTVLGTRRYLNQKCVDELAQRIQNTLESMANYSHIQTKTQSSTHAQDDVAGASALNSTGSHQ